MVEGGEGAREIWSLEFYDLGQLESSIGAEACELPHRGKVSVHTG